MVQPNSKGEYYNVDDRVESSLSSNHAVKRFPSSKSDNKKLKTISKAEN